MKNFPENLSATSVKPPPSAGRHHLAIYGALCRNSIIRDMQFKTNFLLWIFVEALWFALQLAFVAVIYSHTDRIATWTRWEVVLLTGASQVIQQSFQGLFLNNVVALSEHVRTGRLDFLLLLPVNARFLISLRTIDPGSLFGVFSGLAVMAYACRQMHLVPDWNQIAGFGLLCVFGILIHYSLMFLLASASFLSVKAQGIVWGYFNLFNIARLPDAAFRGPFRAFFTFGIPMLLVSNVPVKYFADKLDSPREIFWLIGMAVLCFLVSEFGWRRALARYTSASS